MTVTSSTNWSGIAGKDVMAAAVCVCVCACTHVCVCVCMYILTQILFARAN